MSWWQEGVIYHVYPRSFADADGDGVGDLRGLAGRLDHLRRLGVDAVWLSPIYRSPMKDFGYDITDHTAIEPEFGTFDDFDALVAAAHERGLRVLLDFVPNHTSDEHPWFREHPDWYLWSDRPRNNWISVFGGPAWTLDPERGQFYYHAYLREQPDLNWRNPALREAMLGVLRFWLDRGVDGFRVDALRQVLKDPDWRDNPPNPDFRPGLPEYDSLLPVRSADHDDLAPVAAMAEVIAERDGVMIGELYLPFERLARYYAAGVHLPSNMHLISAPWQPAALADLIERYEAALPPGAWPNWVLGNHDRHRVATRLGPEQARVAAMLLLTLRGTPTVYYGDELGMTDVEIPPDRVQDPYERNSPGLGVGRDPARTPMQWSDGPGAGFTDGEPWLPLGDLATNVEAQRRDPGSMLNLHRDLIALRREFAREPYRTVSADDATFVFRRGDRWAVVLNLSDEPVPMPLRGRVRLSTHPDRADALRPAEGVVVEIAAR
ncbi:MAG TPA: alpha-amylase family glycosyl hydrolase [Solirubrobacteraceae bacterium]|nr:alpha-amylase family glycosyl hydrolase [Solirubrobacteraceae bacterium]